MRGHIRKRGERSWAIIFDLGRDVSGKRRQKWHTVHGTKKDAQRELNKLLNDLQTGGYVEPAKMSVGEYLSKWLADYAKTNVAPKTYERYEEIIRLHLVPALGHHPLSRVQPLHIQECYSKALSNGRIDGKGGLSRRTVLHHHRVLHEALKQAVKWQLLARNPADAVEPPKPRSQEIMPPTASETANLLHASRETRLFIPILLAATTGMRRGEVLGIRWQDIDLKRAVLRVRQSVEETRAGLRFKEPKTSKARRAIALPSLAVEGLRQCRSEQAALRLKLGPAYEDNDLVCARPDGRPWKPGSFTADFVGLVRRMGLRHVTFHQLRHGHATQLLVDGVHPKVVSERLGHSGIGITLDLYSHVLPTLQEEAAEKVNAALRVALSDED